MYGKATRAAPRARPSTPGRAHSGRRVRAHSQSIASSEAYRSLEKPRPHSPATRPRTATNQMSDIDVNVRLSATRTTISSPCRMRATIEEVTAESTTKPKVSAVNSTRITSRANTAPARGAWNVAAIPAADPHEANRTTRETGMRSHDAMVDPSDAPTCTIGPSRPAEPPEPIVRAEATILTMATRPGMRPPFRRTASITSGMPWPFAEGAKRWMSGPYSRPAIAGESSRNSHGAHPHTPCDWPMWVVYSSKPVDTHVHARIARLKTTAAAPTTAPTRAAVTPSRERCAATVWPTCKRVPAAGSSDCGD